MSFYYKVINWCGSPPFTAQTLRVKEPHLPLCYWLWVRISESGPNRVSTSISTCSSVGTSIYTWKLCSDHEPSFNSSSTWIPMKSPALHTPQALGQIKYLETNTDKADLDPDQNFEAWVCCLVQMAAIPLLLGLGIKRPWLTYQLCLFTFYVALGKSLNLSFPISLRYLPHRTIVMITHTVLVMC